MKCPACGAATCYVGFDGSRVIIQCQKDPLHFFFPKELFLKKEFLLEIITERKKELGGIISKLAPDLKEEYPDTELSMIVIDPEEAKRVASIGSRIEFSITGKIEEDEVKKLNNKYAMTIRVIAWVLEGRRDFKRRVNIRKLEQV